jgi:LysM repeat protein
MRKTVALLIVFAILSVPMMAEGAARTNGLILSTSTEDFSEWQWKGKTKDTQFRLLSGKAQANQFLRELPLLARKPIADAMADIDFQREVAIVAYLGGTSGGYDVEIGQLNINDRSLLVRVGMRSPGKDDVVTMILTHPFDIVTLPRKDMPKGDFEFIVFNQHGDAVVDKWMNLKTPQKTVVKKAQWHTVRTGETLWSIAQRYGVSINSILTVNPKIDPDKIWIGQKLRVPGVQAPRLNPVTSATYAVRTGDSLWRIAKEHKVTIEELMEWNNLTGYDLWIGQELIIQS